MVIKAFRRLCVTQPVFQVLPTESAISTFNFLNDEHRCVAAALIPPENLTVTEDDILQAENRAKTAWMARMDDYLGIDEPKKS